MYVFEKSTVTLFHIEQFVARLQ